ncbi:hypothetical protein HYFRA_00010668 [Hymenoscyphus fraxineus]|uniref:Hydrophobin n=1 Tax=Hymenoscyphus fraxineus TaxID=746836 RepID=A0A9N9L6V0_9HELO|nr:hypothetical protein HYFRA_00010668 [Hymenoscyphus fraxineus]
MQIAKVLTALMPLIIAVSAQGKRDTFCRSGGVGLPVGGSCNGQVRCCTERGRTEDFQTANFCSLITDSEGSTTNCGGGRVQCC